MTGSEIELLKFAKQICRRLNQIVEILERQDRLNRYYIENIETGQRKDGVMVFQKVIKV